MTLKEIESWIKENAPNCQTITWTGGEPTDQLTEEIISHFQKYHQTIETSGLNPVPKGIDLISLSPKVAEHVIKKNFPEGVTEIRYIRHKGQGIPKPSIKADHLYLSPHSDGFTINSENVKHCIDLCLKYPEWKLSLQDHKIWKVL
jgi:organic radical activating enzyme